MQMTINGAMRLARISKGKIPFSQLNCSDMLGVTAESKLTIATAGVRRAALQILN